MRYKCVTCHSEEGRINHITGLNAESYDLNKCNTCGVGTIYPRPSNSYLESFYENYEGLVKSNILETDNSEDFIRVNLSVIEDCKQRLAWVQQYIKLGENARYLDVGCGYGFSVYAGNSIGLCSSGIDYDANAVNLGRNNLSIELHASSLESLSTNGGNGYDLITEWQVLEHISDLESHMHQLRLMLNEGGIFAGTVPNYGGVYAKLMREKWYMIRPPEHLNYFTERGLASLFERHGFSILFIGTKFRTAAPLIQFGLRQILSKRIAVSSGGEKTFMKFLYRFVTLVKRYLFYFPLNSLIYYFRLGGNSSFFVVSKSTVDKKTSRRSIFS